MRPAHPGAWPFFVHVIEGVRHIALDKQQQRLNGEINSPEVRLVGVEGEQLGIVSLAEALAKAEAAELDLVEIAPTAKPPVCRIMDYGKFKYRESKKQHEAKLKLKQIKVKEVKFRPGTDEGDYKIKLRNLIQFLGEGDKAKITLRFRGREMAHQEFGVRLLERIRADLEPHATVESFPRLEGRQMVMLLAPKKVQVQKHPTHKPEAGKQTSDDEAKASPSVAKPRAKESTTVGSK
ncbi:MAG TPA: translation initiation factor IF-3 [Casimicrobiaceae bacterium]|nr:translation initiation factor IF-3 [Casimicrobiaceae bacterium]